MGLFWWLQGDVIFKAKRRSREWQLHLPLMLVATYLPHTILYLETYPSVLLGHPTIIFLNYLFIFILCMGSVYCTNCTYWPKIQLKLLKFLVYFCSVRVQYIFSVCNDSTQNPCSKIVKSCNMKLDIL